MSAQNYSRGNAQGYEDWRRMGCAGWGDDDVPPCFRKAEDNDTFGAIA